MSDADRRIVVVGAHAPGVLVRVKRIPVAGETVIGTDYAEPLDGGKGSNQAIAAARLGGSVAFVGRVGRDSRGELALRLLRDAGVDTSWVVCSDDQPTGSGVNLLDDTGTPAMVTVLGANAQLCTDDVDRALDATPASSVLLVDLEIPVEVALHALARGRARGMRTVFNAAPASVHLDQLGNGTIDVLVVNESEAETLLDGGADGTDLATELRARTGIPAVVVTLGSRGYAVADPTGASSAPVYEVDTVDTSGAGDVFCAALAVQLAGGQRLRDACSWAARAAAVSVTRAGTIEAFPTAPEVDRLAAAAEEGSG